MSALLSQPEGICFDAEGNLFIADRNNPRIRRIGTDGRISTFAGTGDRAFAGDGGPDVKASFQTPAAVSVDATGVLYAAE